MMSLDVGRIGKVNPLCNPYIKGTTIPCDYEKQACGLVYLYSNNYRIFLHYTCQPTFPSFVLRNEITAGSTVLSPDLRHDVNITRDAFQLCSKYH